MKKKLLSVLLSAVMVFGSVNVTSFAAEQYGTDTFVAVEEVSQRDKSAEEASDIVTEPEDKGDEQAEEEEQLGGGADAADSEQMVEETSKEEDSKASKEDSRDGAGTEGFSEQADLGNDDSEIITVKGELDGVYQFGEAPSERKIAAYSARADLDEEANVAAAEEYLYEQMKQRVVPIDISKYNLSIAVAINAVSGLINDHPELYFVQKNFSYSYSGSTCVSIKLTYENGLDDDAFYESADMALACVKPDMSDLEKAIVLHDYLVVNCEYDYDNYNAGTVPNISHSAYGPLVNHIAVCDGYALAYEYLLNQVGIKCYMVTSDEMKHAWNLIVLDGKYYQVDVTWDDPTRDRIGRVGHTYMFCSDDEFKGKEEPNQPHDKWVVTEGAYVVDYKATDTLYDNAFWTDVSSPLVLTGNRCYYTVFDEEAGTAKIKKINFPDITAVGEDIRDIGIWTVWDKPNSYWQGVYSGLFCVNNRLYYNNKESIFSISLDGSGVKTEFTADTTGGYIYGSTFCNGKVYYVLRETPTIMQKENRLEAAIDFSTDDSEAKASITCLKTKTAYRHSESINLDDLRVMYHGVDGTIRRLNSSEYTTNVQSIDTSTSGRKILIVTYENGSDRLTAEVTLTVSPEEGSDTGESGSDVESNSAEESGSDVESTSTDESSSSVESSSASESSNEIESSDASESSNVPEGSDTSESSNEPESSDASESSDMSESSFTSESSTTSESSDISESSDASESSAISESSDMSESSDASESSAASESSNEPESSDASESNDMPESGSIPESSTTPESSDASESSSTEESDTQDNRIDINTLDITVSKIKPKVYDGNGYEPVVKVTYKENKKTITLTEGADYSIKYEANINAGTGAVAIVGIDDYKGRYVQKFTINPKPIKKLKVVTGSYVGTVSPDKLEKLPIYVYDGTKKLKLNTDYILSECKEIKAGSWQVKVEATESSNYTGSVLAKFTVYESGTKIINPEHIKLNKESVSYTGKAIKDVEPIVTVGGVPLINGKDYKVQYQNNKDAGTAYVIVTGKGEYKGKVVVPFKIKAEATPLKVEVKAANAYSGKLQKPAVTVTVTKDGKTKKLGKKDYSVAYENNFHAGTATIFVNGKGNYAGLSKNVTFTIKRQEIKKVSVKGTQENLTLTYGKRNLKEGKDYTIKYGELNKNKIKVTITGRGDFMGVVEKSVKVK